MRSGPNRRGIKKFTQGIQKELDKNPVYVRVEGENSELTQAPGGIVNHYHGPVFQQDANGAQIAWGNSGSVHQEQQHSNSVAAGYEEIAEAIAVALQQLPGVALDDQTREDVARAGNDVLIEATKPEPDRSLVKRASDGFKGALSTVALGLSTGAGAGAQDWAHQTIAQLPPL